MAGRLPQVEHVKQTFLNEISSAKNLVEAIYAIPQNVRPSNQISLHPKYAQQVVELAFMAVVAAWEEFLEQTLVRYLAGAKTANGYAPTPKYGAANTIQHAYELLSQDANYDGSRKYIKASDPQWIQSSADFYFSTHSYACLHNKIYLLKHANSIRNRVAHNSEKCRADFKATAIFFLQPPNDTLSQGFGPARLLLEPVQRHFGQPAVQARKIHLAMYFRMYEDLANQIVP